MGIEEAAIIGGASLLSTGAGLWGSEKAADAQAKGASKASKALMQMYYQLRADLMPWLNAGYWALGHPTGEEYKFNASEYLQMYPDVANWEGGSAEDHYNMYGRAEGRYPSLEAQKAGSQTYKEPSGIYALLEPGSDKTAVIRETPGYKFRLEEGQKAIERSAAARGNLLGGATKKALIRYGQDYASNEFQNYLNNLLGLSEGGRQTAGTIANVGMTAATGQAQNYLAAGNARASGYINQANAITGGLRSGVQDYMYYNYLQKAPQPYTTLMPQNSGYYAAPY